MQQLVGLIPAAGKGTRAYPYTKKTPKCMLEINGVPNLLRTIMLMRDNLKIHEIYIVVGYQGETIQEYFSDGKKFDVQINYIENDAIDKGLAYSVSLGKKFINDYFLIILSDECYVNSNHYELLSAPFREAFATIAIKEVDNKLLIKQNYSVEIQHDYITKLIEKPKILTNNILGCGTFIFHPGIFQYIDHAFESADGKPVDFITLINNQCCQAEKVRYFKLKGEYVNINDRDSLHIAKYYVRENYFDKNEITLLIYSEGDEEDIEFTINQYKKAPCIDNIYVLFPEKNSIEDIVKSSGVKSIKCPPKLRLYGEKIKYGLEQIPGEIFIITEANYSFSNRDISKLIAYIKEADMVIGTRTTRQLIQQRSNMRGIVRLANILLAKFLELLWWDYECRFTDVGCTFRALWKSTFYKIKENLVSKGPEFSVEMNLEILRARDRIIEIPVNYYGRSYSLYRKYQNLNTFFRMFQLICLRSIRHYFKDR